VAPARPPLAGPPDRAAILAALQRHIYGAIPTWPAAALGERTPLPLDETLVGERWQVSLGAMGGFPMAVFLPARTPAPVVLAQAYCGLRAALPGRPSAAPKAGSPTHWTCRCPPIDPLLPLALGRWGRTLPVRRLLARGYGLALMHAGDVVPDKPTKARATLARLQPDLSPEDRGGALAAWAGLYGRALDVLAADSRIGPVALWGHSRYGKAVLLAAAIDQRPAAVISHQSGRGGASLSRSPFGETIAQATKRFPHWFGAAYAGYAGREAELPVDQHQLLALTAPRPLLLGYGEDDRWSDPAGGRRAFEGARPAWPDPDGLRFYRRPGGHGVTDGDWTAFLDFLDARLRRRGLPPA
jgi:hypothetical protein